MLDLLIIEWVTKMKPSSNSIEDHPQLSHNRHLVDGALLSVGSLWPTNMISDHFLVIGSYLPTKWPSINIFQL